MRGLTNDGIESCMDNNNYSTLNIKFNGMPFDFRYRKSSIGDRGVIDQIFKNQDYNFSNWYQGKKLLDYYEKIKDSNPLIVDAGANIGASAVYFARKFIQSRVFAIEPDHENWELLSLNTKNLNCHAYHGAISSNDGYMQLIDPGRSDWGFMTRDIQDVDVIGSKKISCMSPFGVMRHEFNTGATPFIFKIDIEGGEEKLFSGNNSWMDQFPLLIIELHDWMLPFSGTTRNFIKAVAERDFDLIHRGENMFLFNKSIIIGNKY